MDVRAIGCEVVDWSQLTLKKYQQRAFMKAVMNVGFP